MRNISTRTWMYNIYFTFDYMVLNFNALVTPN